MGFKTQRVSIQCLNLVHVAILLQQAFFNYKLHMGVVQSHDFSDSQPREQQVWMDPLTVRGEVKGSWARWVKNFWTKQDFSTRTQIRGGVERPAIVGFFCVWRPHRFHVRSQNLTTHMFVNSVGVLRVRSFLAWPCCHKRVNRNKAASYLPSPVASAHFLF